MKIVRRVNLLAAVLLPLAFAEATAQGASAINAERPSFSSSPLVIAPSTWQIEGGYEFASSDNGPDVETHAVPLALLRVGLTDALELQLNWAGVVSVDVDGQSESGTTDLGVGVKWQLTEDGASVPVALFAGVSLPVGETGFSSDGVDPTLGLFWTYSSTLEWFGTVLLSESDADMMLSNAVGISVPLSASLGSYVEYVGQFPDDGGPQHSLNGGLTYAPRPNLQLDLHLGLGLNDRARDVVVGAGAAYRF